MKLAVRKERRQAETDRPTEDGRVPATRRWTVLSRAIDAPWTDAGPAPVSPGRELPPIVALPVTPDQPPAPRVTAEADLRIKRYGADRVEHERYAVTLHAAASPAALLAALADAAARIDDLAHDGSPADPLILTISLRR